MQRKKSNSLIKKGMNRSVHPSQLKPEEYSFLLNGNTENETGDLLNITNEPSNYLEITFPEGYKVIGYEKHPTLPITYYFLTNPQTGYSSFGYVENSLVNLQYQEDTETVCNDCDHYGILPTPLEDITQTPYNEYVELLEDLCNGGFNFSINHPIKHIEIKVDKLGTTIYFVDGYNPDRYIDIDKIEQYKYTGNIVCGIDETVPTCVDVEKMLQSPNYSIFDITPEVVQIGGNLRNGTYQFLGAYCDAQGNEITDYESITQPISIFDENNRILNQTELDAFTNFAIKLDVSNVDTKFNYYKIVVIERAAVNQAESYFVEGIHPTSDKSILYNSTQTGTENIGGITQRINYDRVFSQRVKYEHSRGIEASNDQLFKYGLKGKRFPNLQPIVNFIGGFLKWNSSIAKEDLYKNPIATSNYRGYMREEVQPFGIRFFNKDGSKYPVFPLVARPALPTDLETVSPTDKNYLSVTAKAGSCATTDRNKKWQLYNTSTVEGSCAEITSNGVTEQQKSTCIVSDVDSLDNSEVSFSTTEGVTDLKTYINSNLADIQNPASGKYIAEIADYLNNEYPDDNCTPTFSDNCGTSSLESYLVNVQEVTNEVQSISYDEDILNYERNVPANYCQPFQKDNDGNYIADTDFQTDYDLTNVYLRESGIVNEDCSYAVNVLNNNPNSTPPTGYYHNYYGANTSAELIDSDITISTTNTNFLSNLHTGALWFKINKNGRDKIIFEITPNGACNNVDDIPEVNELRYSFFESCSSTSDIGGDIISTSTGEFITVDISSFPDIFYVTVEAPIVQTSNMKYRTAPPCGCFGILTRDLNITGVNISFDSIIFQKTETYVSECQYEIPDVNNCNPIPYQYGSFSYWESTDTYPDNKELYDSSVLSIEPVDISALTEEQKQQFRDYYTQGTTGSVFNLKEDTDLRCKPIRHPKFPSNIISPFMGATDAAPFSEALIFPLGVSLDVDIVNTFLDIAVKNNLLTQKQRDDIEGYEILKGDNSVQKSIVTNAVGFDMYKYQDNGEDVLYPNYPLNDLGRDFVQLQGGTEIQHPFNSQSNYNFSTLSPEFSLNKPTIPTEIIVSGYQIGNSRIYFQDVEDHPKYVLLTQSARNWATVLGIAEAALEAAVLLADFSIQAAQTQWIVAGTSTGGNQIGAVTSGAALGVYLTSVGVNGVIKAGQYRLQWLQTMENFGQPRNFSSYCTAEGYHNGFLKNNLTTELVRGISASKYIKDGKWTFKDEFTGDSIRINNEDREYSTFISLGEDYPIQYPAEYYNYDNNNVSVAEGSRTILSVSGAQQNQEIVNNSAVPYITFKNYIPNQYGTVDSIKWLSTSYRKRLNESSFCDIIYGGTVFISRDIQKRKHPIFRADAFGQANMTPFSYRDYKNIGDPRFFIDFRDGGSSNFGDFLFPDLNSEYTLDNINSSEFYVRASSKFYLYYYGFASYLVESEVNTNFRYGRTQLKDQYYPDIQGDMEFFTQEKNLSIKEPVTYYYNNNYSRQVSQTPYRTYPVTYSKEVYDKINDSDNGVIYSLPDKSENDLTDPWLIYLPLNSGEFKTSYGKLISIESLESETLVARFENTEVLLNSVDELSKELNPITIEIGSGNIFAKRQLQSVKTGLGHGGTQNTDYLLTPYGHFSVDAKRGQINRRNGQNVEPVSDFIGGELSGLKNWLREQLPYKILKDFPQVDIDNKFKGLGIALGYDNKSDRVFVTKKDVKVINKECLQWDEELGIVVNSSKCGTPPVLTCPAGYTYNEVTGFCEKDITYPACPEGYTYNEVTGRCETEGSATLLCPEGWTYNSENQTCQLDEEIQIALPCGENCNIVSQLDGNAYCVCPADETDNLCEGCDISGNETCPEGYTYNSDTDKCEKILPFCPPYEGYFTGGTFNNTGFKRIYNSENDILDINNGFVQVFKRQQQDGKILVGGGFTLTSEGAINSMFRLNVDGSYDNTFDIGTGFADPITTSVPTVRGIDVYEDGRIIVVGDFSTYNGVTVNGAVRLNSDGSIDNTFTTLTGFNSTPFTVRIVEDEKILIGSVGNYRGNSTKGVIKLLPNGDIDNTFAGNRFDSFTQGSPTNELKQCYTIEVQPDGKYLFGGNFREYAGVESRKLVRVNINGSIDYSFTVAGGFVDVPTPPAQTNLAFTYKVQMQGDKILVAGKFKTYKGQSVQGIVRLDSSGNLDPTFNNNKVILGTNGGIVYDFDTNTAGEILIGGNYTSYDGNSIGYITLTDVNGYSTYFTDPEFVSTVFSVLNTPRCEECDCDSFVLPNDDVLCSCDPVLSEPMCNCVDQVEPTYEDVLTPVDYTDENYFEDTSWTVAFKPTLNSWISYYSFKPNYYVNYAEYFDTGINYGDAAETIWSHTLENKSFQVFYGQKYPFIVEFPIVNEGVNKLLNSISVNSEVRRWTDEWDYNVWNRIGFDRAVVYNQTNNSNMLELVQQQTMSDVRNYPETLSDRQKILYTSIDGEHHFNYFYNRVINQNNNLPIWKNDNVMILKDLNTQTVSFKGKKLLERMRGKDFFVRLYNTEETRLQTILKYSTNDETAYE